MPAGLFAGRFGNKIKSNVRKVWEKAKIRRNYDSAVKKHSWLASYRRLDETKSLLGKPIKESRWEAAIKKRLRKIIEKRKNLLTYAKEELLLKQGSFTEKLGWYSGAFFLTNFLLKASAKVTMEIFVTLQHLKAGDLFYVPTIVLVKVPEIISYALNPATAFFKLSLNKLVLKNDMIEVDDAALNGMRSSYLYTQHNSLLAMDIRKNSVEFTKEDLKTSLKKDKQEKLFSARLGEIFKAMEMKMKVDELWDAISTLPEKHTQREITTTR